jgi:hypothetical protein
MVIVSNNHGESIILNIYYLHALIFTKIGNRSTLALLLNTGWSTIGGNGRQLIKSWVQLYHSY